MTRSSPVEVEARRRRGGRDRARGRARGLRGPAAARPARRRARRDRRVDRGAGWPRTAGCSPASTASRSARWCSTRSAAPCTCAASASSPTAQGHGVAAALIEAAVEAADGYDDLTVVAREELPADRPVLGAAGLPRDPPRRAERRAAPPAAHPVYQAPDAEAMRGLGRSLAGQLAAGDLSCSPASSAPARRRSPRGSAPGSASAAQVTSPTFVIARVHPPLVGGPALVHVDAYRLGGIDELDDLDLDTSLDEAVTVVEWGEGLAEGLAESRLEVDIVRGDEDDDEPPARVEITPVGPRWHVLSFRGLG